MPGLVLLAFAGAAAGCYSTTRTLADEPRVVRTSEIELAADEPAIALQLEVDGDGALVGEVVWTRHCRVAYETTTHQKVVVSEEPNDAVNALALVGSLGVIAGGASMIGVSPNASSDAVCPEDTNGEPDICLSNRAWLIVGGVTVGLLGAAGVWGSSRALVADDESYDEDEEVTSSPRQFHPELVPCGTSDELVGRKLVLLHDERAVTGQIDERARVRFQVVPPREVTTPADELAPRAVVVSKGPLATFGVARIVVDMTSYVSAVAQSQRAAEGEAPP